MSLRTLSYALIAFGLAGGAHAATVFSDDFETGASTGSTAYTLTGTGVFTTPGDYAVISDPGTAWTNGYIHSFDHTLGTADGHMLFYDGLDAQQTIWGTTASLVAGQSYTISYWANWSIAAPPGVHTNSLGGDPQAPVTQLLIDGAAAGASIQTSGPQWTGTAYTFTADHSGTYNFAIVDLNTVAVGNDGSIDDIRLVTTPVPEPGAPALLLAGLGLVGLVARRRVQRR